MSSIGPSHPAGFNLASSFAGAQRTTGQQDETKAQQAAQRFQVDENENDSLDKDVEEADLDADRDADGRQDLVAPPGETVDEVQQEAADADSDAGPIRHAPDAFGLRGGQLDFDA